MPLYDVHHDIGACRRTDTTRRLSVLEIDISRRQIADVRFTTESATNERHLVATESQRRRLHRVRRAVT